MTQLSELSVWEKRYQDGHTGWDRGESSEALQLWLKNHPIPAGKILIPGCGNGYEVMALAALGFQVTAIDIAPTPIAQLRQALKEEKLEAEVVQMDMFDYQTNEGFDWIYEQTCLCAIAPDQRSDYVDRLWQWLKPSGTLLAMFMQTDRSGGPPYHCAMDDMAHLFSSQSWHWPDQADFEISLSSGLRELAWRLRKKDR